MFLCSVFGKVWDYKHVSQHPDWVFLKSAHINAYSQMEGEKNNWIYLSHPELKSQLWSVIQLEARTKLFKGFILMYALKNTSYLIFSKYMIF